MTKFFRYDSCDDVNNYEADQLMAERGVILVPPYATNGPIAARLVDLDYQPFGDRGPILQELLQHKPACPTAVHAYNLDEDTAARVRERGILVFRKLDGYLIEVLLDLCDDPGSKPPRLTETETVPPAEDEEESGH